MALRDYSDFSAAKHSSAQAAGLQRNVWLHVAAACLFLAATSVLMAWQPLTADENEFFLAAANWQQNRSLIPHPQLFVHWMQLFMAFFGPSVAAVRLSVLLPNLVTIVLTAWVARLVYRNTLTGSGAQTAAILAVWLVALCPLTVQDSVLIDIDNSVLTTAVLALLGLWIATGRMAPVLRVVLLSLLFAVCLWFKLPTPPMVVAAIAAYSLLRGHWKDAVVAIAFGVVGTMIFLAWHAIYSAYTGFTIGDAVAAFLWRTQVGTGFLKGLEAIAPQGFGVFLFWIGATTSVLFLIALIYSVARFLRRQAHDEDLLILFGAIVIVFYTVMLVPPWGYPRYHAPALPVMMIAVAGLWCDTGPPVIHDCPGCWQASSPRRLSTSSGGSAILFLLSTRRRLRASVSVPAWNPEQACSPPSTPPCWRSAPWHCFSWPPGVF